uniref:Uncharacterized protein n=1 Tax=Arundo donax TaxID=35708 RepID=A0A0A9GW82_ARUDO
MMASALTSQCFKHHELQKVRLLQKVHVLQKAHVCEIGNVSLELGTPYICTSLKWYIQVQMTAW